MKVTQWLVAATLLVSVGSFAKAQDVTLPDKGTTEWNVAGNIGLDKDTTWNIGGRWAPFINQNLQWGVDLTAFDGPGISTSGTYGVFVNWHFPSEGSQVLPYIGVGGGGTYGDLDGGFWEGHGGIKYFVTSDVALTAELLYQHLSSGASVFNGGRNHITEINFGVSVFSH
jgi:hypothetical protein